MMAQLPTNFPGHDALVQAGYTTEAKVAKASDENLLAVPGIGPATLQHIRDASKPVDEAPADDAEVTEQPAVEELPAPPPEPFVCGNPRCGYEITSYPCGYCGFQQ